jgi:hypothetical protein
MSKKEKLTKRVDVRMSASELAVIKSAAQERWPGAVRLMSLSAIVRSLALIAVQSKT